MDDIKLYEEMIRMKKAGRAGVLVTVVESRGSTPRKAGAKMLVRDDRSTLGTVGGGAVERRALQAANEVFATGRARSIVCELTEAHGMTCGGSLQLFLEPLARIPRLLIVGKGHIGQALQDLGTRTGFAVTMLEPPEDEQSCCELRQELDCRLNEQTTYVVIACPTHPQDFLAARIVLENQPHFVGMVGSRRKRTSMETYLAENGCRETAIASVCTPVGLDIAAETPAEIALSILAQIVRDYRHYDQHIVSNSSGCRPIPTDGS
ncbi:MAG: XdhC family protein [Desulfuromonadales bacterium]|nr:XdhC family protein [Desulfuromonadales bacterium]